MQRRRLLGPARDVPLDRLVQRQLLGQIHHAHLVVLSPLVLAQPGRDRPLALESLLHHLLGAELGFRRRGGTTEEETETDSGHDQGRFRGGV
jgi:hypothetical protein